MNNNYNKLFSTIVIFLSITMTIFSQTGYVTGVVYDSDGTFTLPGANIYLKTSPSTGTITELDGTFILDNINEGTYTLMVSYTGYETQELPITIAKSSPAKLDITMAPMAILGEEIIVTAQALGQNKAINQQLNSDAIANIVSAEKIKELPDVNAAEAISRLPGVAINRDGGEGSKIVVRGLDPKFTAISVNGIRLPSTGGSDRSVDLSLISPELLSGIELFKSPTPDMDGDALGGSVNLNILRAPKERKISIKGLTGYNFLGGTFTDYKATVSLAQRILKDKVGIIATANTERFNRGGETINQGWQDDLNVVQDTLLDIFGQQATNLQFQKREESRKRVNGSLGFDWQLGNRSEFNLLGLYSKTSRDRYNHTERYDVENNRLTYVPRIIENSIDLVSGSLSASHNLGFLKIDWGAALSRVRGMTPYDFEIEFRNDKKPFQEAAFKDRSNPSTFYGYVNNNPDADYLQGAVNIQSDNSEVIRTAFANFTIPIISKSNVNVEFKVGGKAVLSEKERNYNEDYFKNYYLVNNSKFADFVPEGKGATGVDPSGKFYYGMSNFTNNGSIEITNQAGNKVPLFASFDQDKLRRFKDLYQSGLRENRYSSFNNYNLTENVYATYGMFKIKFGQKLTIIPGIRYELSDNNYQGTYSDLSGDFGESGSILDVSKDRNYGILLPHLHLKYKPLDWFDIRASYSTTLARPDFEYLIPYTLVNRASDLVISQGNPDLNPSVSTNYDLFLTAYNGKYGLLSIGAFYKDIKDAFYPLIVGLNNDSLAVAYGFPEDGFTGGELTTFVNSPNSSVTGFEMELQSNLNFLPGALKGLVWSINYTRLFSQTTINSFYEETEIKGTFPFFQTVVNLYPYQREVDLVGQARHIFNTSLGYDIKSFSARVSSSYQGTKISGYSSSADKDRFNQGFWRFDLVLKQRFGRNFNVFLNVNNISNQKDINFFRSETFRTSNSVYGSTATIGAEYIIR